MARYRNCHVDPLLRSHINIRQPEINEDLLNLESPNITQELEGELYPENISLKSIYSDTENIDNVEDDYSTSKQNSNWDEYLDSFNREFVEKSRQLMTLARNQDSAPPHGFGNSEYFSNSKDSEHYRNQSQNRTHSTNLDDDIKKPRKSSLHSFFRHFYYGFVVPFLFLMVVWLCDSSSKLRNSHYYGSES